MTVWHLAQVNVGRLVAAITDPRLADFQANLDRINRLAEAQPGFIWRLKDEGPDQGASGIVIDTDPNALINASIWVDANALGAFVYRTEHREFLRRKAEWFIPSEDPFLALWWVKEHTRLTTKDCLERLAHLKLHGPTPQAFTFQTRFDPPQAMAQSPSQGLLSPMS